MSFLGKSAKNKSFKMSVITSFATEKFHKNSAFQKLYLKTAYIIDSRGLYRLSQTACLLLT
ncbi:hypothetical protein AAJ76_1480001009 [Vairimorpha ceranae]|uniref:Uncharacterized protein n=1 Tax=Vairimorpha ceranae TaxID=40302 RepID=A0A0F9WAN2_9MICR|nr:hypothetical protein AAJ76_1480001009 [Vairimorpha ceranae]KKO73990.1 hypothetical protein AAJ76_1480001009 [Vairimorpha ceranae]